MTGARRVLLILLVAAAVIDLCTLGARAVYLLRLGEVPRLASEGQVLYSIWKIRHGYALYESPFAPYFPVTLYNFLSYETYAAAFRFFAVEDSRTPQAGHAVTAAFAAIGAALQYLAARELLRGTRAGRAVPLLLAVITWTGPVLPGWWSMAIRPDVGAVTLDLAGIYVVLKVLNGTPDRWLLWASAAFFAAWGFKQSHVTVCAATAVYLLVWRRSWRQAALVSVPCAAGVALTLALGGALYRANTIAAPALSPLLPLYAWFGLRTIAIPELLFWLSAAAAAVALLSRARDMPAQSLRVFGVDLVYPALLAVASAAAAVPMLAKAGSAINHAIEPKVCAALVTAGLLSGAAARGRAIHAAASVAVGVMLVSQGSRLRVEREVLMDGLRGTDGSAASRRATAAIVANLPRPVYTDDELYALPWIANGNAYPAVMPDYQVYHAAKDAHALTDTVEAMVERRVFGSLAVADTSPLVPLAQRSGYELVETVPQIRDRPLVILRRPGF